RYLVEHPTSQQRSRERANVVSFQEAQGFERIEFQVAEHAVEVPTPAHDARERTLGPKATEVFAEEVLHAHFGFSSGELRTHGSTTLCAQGFAGDDAARTPKKIL